MIFLTVGSQTPFDRLVRVVDGWAGEKGVDDVQAQIGDGEYWPSHLRAARELSPTAFAEVVAAADLIVGHAGMGTILTALQFQKPMLLFPRRGDLRETRNDHQLATARKLAGRAGIRVAFDEDELRSALDTQPDAAPSAISPFANADLLATVREYLFDAQVARR